jgi:hypothetical protein
VAGTFIEQSITRDDKNAGKGTIIKAPFPSNVTLEVVLELNGLILAHNIILSPQGYLSKSLIYIAVKLSITFGLIETVEDEEGHLRSLHQANVYVHNVHNALNKSKTKQTADPVMTTG